MDGRTREGRAARAAQALHAFRPRFLEGAAPDGKRRVTRCLGDQVAQEAAIEAFNEMLAHIQRTAPQPAAPDQPERSE